MSHVMLEAVIRMPYKIAMHSEISRRQFYGRANQALDEMEAYANARVKQALEEAIKEVMRCKTSGIIRNDTVDKCADAIRALIP